MATEPITGDFAPPAGGRRLGDKGLRVLAAAAALILAVLMALLLWKVLDGAWPSIQEFGLQFITGTTWNSVTNEFGARYLILGTLFTSVVTLCMAVPIGIAIGIFLSELAPGWVRTPIGMLVELLAAIPSVILGLWGIIVMGPFLAQHVEPWLNDHLGFIPLFSGYPSPVGLLPACILLTIMCVPIIASISRELFLSVPGDLKQGAMGLGATRWEMIRQVAIPQVGSGLVAGSMLAFGRAAGEAIAVTQVIGGALGWHWSLFASSNTLASMIAATFNGTPTSLGKASLFYLALILLAISLITNLAAQRIVARMNRKREARA